MKKRLEADLVSIAHRILQMKNKSDVNALFLETQKLYEKLAILKFVEENLGEIKPTIGKADLEIEIEKTFENPIIEPAIVSTETENTIEESTIETPIEELSLSKETELAPEETIVETVIAEKELEEFIEEKIEEEVENKKEIPNEELEIPLHFDTVVPEKTTKKEPVFESKSEEHHNAPQVMQISFEDLLGGNYTETEFVKVESLPSTPKKPIVEAAFHVELDKMEPLVQEIESKPKSLNDKLAKGIAFDLNDRIGFIQQLFDNDSEDFNRVMSQLNSFESFHETKTFINEMVKPDYNNWEGKEDYALRFMELIEKKFL